MLNLTESGKMKFTSLVGINYLNKSAFDFMSFICILFKIIALCLLRVKKSFISRLWSCGVVI